MQIKDFLLGASAVIILFLLFQSTPSVPAEPAAILTQEVPTQAPTQPPIAQNPPSQSPLSGLAPCGDVCKYDLVSTPGKYFPVVKKNFVCENIMDRLMNYKPATIWPPPEQIPDHMLKDYTQNGDFPVISKYYLTNRYSGGSAHTNRWEESHIENLRASSRRGQLITSYQMYDEINIKNSLQRFPLQGLRGAVIGSEKPWLEALILNAGAAHITTIEYGKIVSAHPAISTLVPDDAARAYLSGTLEKFDFIYTYSSLEHSGLGRYGDELNPFGDWEAAAQCWCMLKPGGLFFLGLPTGVPEGIYYNAHRIYGPNRLQHMAAGFEQVDHFFDSHLTGSKESQEVYVLRKQ